MTINRQKCLKTLVISELTVHIQPFAAQTKLYSNSVLKPQHLQAGDTVVLTSSAGIIDAHYRINFHASDR
jgi:muramoyltetrapeptide carboxypeptidase